MPLAWDANAAIPEVAEPAVPEHMRVLADYHQEPVLPGDVERRDSSGRHHGGSNGVEAANDGAIEADRRQEQDGSDGPGSQPVATWCVESSIV
jgi:hypothetical protein